MSEITGMTIVPDLVRDAIIAVGETKTVSRHARHLSLHDYDVITRPFRARIRELEAEEAAEDHQIQHMVSRFLSWTLPIDFDPDAGISFDGSGRPSGTNLFTATQAEEMVRFMLESAPSNEPTEDFRQMIYALERARNMNEAHAERLHAEHDYNAEFPAGDAAYLQKAIDRLMAAAPKPPETES